MKNASSDFERFSGKQYPSSVPGYMVFVQRVRTSNGNATIKAYPVDENTGERVAGFYPLRHNIRSTKQWKEDAQSMVGRVDKKLRQANHDSAPAPSVRVAGGPFMERFLSVENRDSLCKDNWAASTIRSTLSDTAFVLSSMDALQVGLDVSGFDMSEIRNMMVERAMASKKSSQNLVTVLNGINTRFNRVGVVYRNLCRVSSGYPLPELNFPLANVAPIIQPEQMKALPDEVRVRFAAALMRRNQDGCVLGAGLMLADGPRTSEAAAVLFGDLMMDGMYCSVPILRQQGEKGTTTDYLKTEAGYRILPLPYFMVALIDKRKAYLRELGYSDERILEMPLVADDKDPSKMAPSQKLSAYIKALLMECGLTNEYLLAALELQANEHDDDRNGKPLDVSAYVLRRDFATRVCNVCSLAPNEVDYLLGHQNKANEGSDFQTPQAQQRLGHLLENYVLHPAHSRHPAYAPVKVPGDDSSFPERAARVALEANEDVTLRIHLHCCEPNSGIKLESGQMLSLENVDISYQKDTPAKRCGRTIVGRIPDSHQLDAWVREENNLAEIVLDDANHFAEKKEMLPWDAL